MYKSSKNNDLTEDDDIDIGMLTSLSSSFFVKIVSPLACLNEPESMLSKVSVIKRLDLLDLFEYKKLFLLVRLSYCLMIFILSLIGVEYADSFLFIGVDMLDFEVIQ